MNCNYIDTFSYYGWFAFFLWISNKMTDFHHTLMTSHENDEIPNNNEENLQKLCNLTQWLIQ